MSYIWVNAITDSWLTPSSMVALSLLWFDVFALVMASTRDCFSIRNRSHLFPAKSCKQRQALQPSHLTVPHCAPRVTGRIPAVAFQGWLRSLHRLTALALANANLIRIDLRHICVASYQITTKSINPWKSEIQSLNGGVFLQKLRWNLRSANFNQYLRIEPAIKTAGTWDLVVYEYLESLWNFCIREKLGTDHFVEKPYS